MAKKDADGVTRWDAEWSIEGAKGTRRGKLYGLHEMEIVGARADLRRSTKRGETADFRTS